MITVNNVTKKYGKTKANNDLNFTVGDGEIAILPVSYTHLDVYKRQPPAHPGGLSI